MRYEETLLRQVARLFEPPPRHREESLEVESGSCGDGGETGTSTATVDYSIAGPGDPVPSGYRWRMWSGC
jgi:hypothetical protein